MPIKDPFPNPADIPIHAIGYADTAGQYRDLCSNCDNGDACVDRTRPKRPIFFCEEFMVFGAAPMSELDRAVQIVSKRTRNTNEHIGLCMNCDAAAACALPKPEGGIWHCEEYR